MTDEALAAFDASHRCACGKIVVARKAKVSRESGICHCHAGSALPVKASYSFFACLSGSD
jgi:hypothetical protein